VIYRRTTKLGDEAMNTALKFRKIALLAA